MLPDELLSRLTSPQLTELIADYGIEPWGDERVDLIGARITQAVLGVAGVKTSIRDHLPDWSGGEESQEDYAEKVKEIERRLIGFALSRGGKKCPRSDR